jgi:tagatose 1,6-diphosphate aldolase GatY/KbaY
MGMLRQEACAADGADLLACMEEAIEAMSEVIAGKLRLFGSINKAHLHETPYATMLTAKRTSVSLG